MRFRFAGRRPAACRQSKPLLVVHSWFDGRHELRATHPGRQQCCCGNAADWHIAPIAARHDPSQSSLRILISPGARVRGGMVCDQSVWRPADRRLVAAASCTGHYHLFPVRTAERSGSHRHRERPADRPCPECGGLAFRQDHWRPALAKPQFVERGATSPAAGAASSWRTTRVGLEGKVR